MTGLNVVEVNIHVQGVNIEKSPKMMNHRLRTSKAVNPLISSEG